MFKLIPLALCIVLSQMTNNSETTKNQLHIKLDSTDNSKDTICDKIRNEFASGTSVDDLFLSLNEDNDLVNVNIEIMKLHQQRKIQRHHIEFDDSLKVDLKDIPKYDSLLLLSGLSVMIKQSKDVVKLFSLLHTMENLQTVKLTMNFQTTENIDNFYETALHEFPKNSVHQLSIDRFLPYAVMFKVIRAFVQQSPNLNRIILYTPLTPNALEHFRSQYVKEMETLVPKSLTVYVRPIDKSIVEQNFGFVLLKSLNDIEESQFESEYPFFVGNINFPIRTNDDEL